MTEEEKTTEEEKRKRYVKAFCDEYLYKIIEKYGSPKRMYERASGGWVLGVPQYVVVPSHAHSWSLGEMEEFIRTEIQRITNALIGGWIMDIEGAPLDRPDLIKMNNMEKYVSELPPDIQEMVKKK